MGEKQQKPNQNPGHLELVQLGSSQKRFSFLGKFQLCIELGLLVHVTLVGLSTSAKRLLAWDICRVPLVFVIISVGTWTYLLRSRRLEHFKKISKSTEL